MWSKSTSVWSSRTFGSNDVVGMFLDMENKTLLFYKNGNAQPPSVSIEWVKKNLHIACLLSNGAEIELKYLGNQPIAQ